MKIACVIGTRPEAIKLAPVILELRERSIDVFIILTSQQPILARETLHTFSLLPDIEFHEAPGAYSLPEMLAFYLELISGALDNIQPDIVVNQGDTTTALAAALAASYKKIPLYHVEAGLRTGSPTSPFPEENHRRLIAVLASMHFAPSAIAKEELRKEGIDENNIVVTGNTVIDALQWILRHHDPKQHKPRPPILITAHRRENLAALHEKYFYTLNDTAKEIPAIRFIFVLHSNPNIAKLAKRIFDAPNIEFVAPVQYASFVPLIKDSLFIITDSGGIQEESGFLGKPLVIIRENTERRELLDGGNIAFIGTDTELLRKTVLRLASDESYRYQYSQPNKAYGCGDAAIKIVDSIMEFDAKRH